MTEFFAIAIVVVLIVLLWLTLEYSLLVPPKKGIPILMYHKVSSSGPDELTISPEALSRQMEYLHRKGYQTLSFGELARIRDGQRALPIRPLILTFDDAYADFREQAFPVLQRFGFRVTVFIPVSFMGKTNEWDKGSDHILSADAIRSLSEHGNLEFGIHSFLHRNYEEMSPEEIREDLEKCFRVLDSEKIRYVPVLAYPYGGYPKKVESRKEAMKKVFRQTGLTFAARIGNRINSWPLKDIYEVRRIDIKGTDTFRTFKIKVRKGRRKLFS